MMKPELFFRCSRTVAMSVAALVALPALAAQIYVTTVPEDGVAVLCNGQFLGHAPLTISDLPPGKHLIAAQKPGYLDERLTVELDAGQRVTRQLTLSPILALVIIDSDPPGAAISIDGTPSGVTPIFFRHLRLGQYRLRIEKEGYLPYETNLSLPSRSPVRHAARLVSNRATLHVTSEPPGAEIIIDGSNRGRTPAEFADVPAGTSELQLVAKGFERATRTVTLAPGRSETVSVTMVPLPSGLQIVTDPPGARVFIDDRSAGSAPITRANMRAGVYQVRAELEGYATVTRRVTLERGETYAADIRLPLDSGILEITTQPAGVRVFVNNSERGQTQAPENLTDRISQPLSIPRIPNGTHTVRLVLVGYIDQEFEVTIANNAAVNVHKEMQRMFIVNFEIETNGARVRGMFVEQLPDGSIRLEVSPGIFETVEANKIRQHRPIRAREPQP